MSRKTFILDPDLEPPLFDPDAETEDEEPSLNLNVPTRSPSSKFQSVILPGSGNVQVCPPSRGAPVRGQPQAPVPARGQIQAPVPARGAPVPARGQPQAPVPARGQPQSQSPTPKTPERLTAASAAAKPGKAEVSEEPEKDELVGLSTSRKPKQLNRLDLGPRINPNFSSRLLNLPPSSNRPASQNIETERVEVLDVDVNFRRGTKNVRLVRESQEQYGLRTPSKEARSRALGKMSYTDLKAYAVKSEIKMKDLVNICLSSENGKKLCDDQSFWTRKFKADYSDEVPDKNVRRAYILKKLNEDFNIETFDKENEDIFDPLEDELIRYRIETELESGINLLTNESFLGSDLKIGYGLGFIAQNTEELEYLQTLQTDLSDYDLVSERLTFVLDDDQIPFAMYYEFVPKLSTSIILAGLNSNPDLHLIGFDPEAAGASSGDNPILPHEFFSDAEEDVKDVRKRSYINIILKEFDERSIKDQNPEIRELFESILNTESTHSGLWMMNYVYPDELERRREEEEERRREEEEERRKEEEEEEKERRKEERETRDLSGSNSQPGSRESSPTRVKREFRENLELGKQRSVRPSVKSQSPPTIPVPQRSRSQSPPAPSRSQSPPPRSTSPPSRSRSPSPSQSPPRSPPPRSRSTSPPPRSRSPSQSPPLI